MRQDKKNYLERYTCSKQEIERLENELMELESVRVLTEEEREMQQDIKERITKERHERLTWFEETRRKIEQLEKTEEKDILVYRHLQNMKWKDIGKKMGYERRQLTRIYNKALEHLKI